MLLVFFEPRQQGSGAALFGYVLTLLGYIPQAGTVVDAHGWRLEVMDMDGLRIDKVLIRKQ
jgi:putative hemolysin